MYPDVPGKRPMLQRQKSPKVSVQRKSVRDPAVGSYGITHPWGDSLPNPMPDFKHVCSNEVNGTTHKPKFFAESGHYSFVL